MSGLAKLEPFRADPDFRRRLKEAVDARRRQLVFRGSEQHRCASCGMPYQQWTPGCTTCQDRWYKWLIVRDGSPEARRRYHRVAQASRDYTETENVRRRSPGGDLHHRVVEGGRRGAAATWAEEAA